MHKYKTVLQAWSYGKYLNKRVEGKEKRRIELFTDTMKAIRINLYILISK